MGPALMGVLIATVAGLMMGSANQRAKRARSDYQKTRSLIPGARRAAWSESLRGLKVLATALAVLFALAFAMHAIGNR